MKFVELKKHILSNNHFACYNLHGDDLFLIDFATNLFFNYVAHNSELNKSVLSTESLDAKKFLAVLNSNSFLGDKKVVLLDGVDASKDKLIIDTIANYAKNPNRQNILLVISQTAILDSKKADAINNSGGSFCAVDCNRLDTPYVFAWINSELKQSNCTMSKEAQQLLVEYSNGYLSKISIEVKKLVDYAKDRQIEADDIKLLVNKDLEYSVFELTENLGKGNAQRTLEILNDMMSNKKSAPMVFSLVQNYFRRIFFASITPSTNAQIAEMLGVKEFAVKKAKDVSQLFSKIALKDIVEMCEDLDGKVKTGKMSYDNAVNYLVMYILGTRKK